MRIAQHLEELTDAALERALGVRAPSVLRPCQNPAHGDFQLNGAMGLAKQLKTSPRELAGKLAEALAELEAVDKAEVAGPGFVNLTLSDAWVAARVAEMVRDERDGVPLASPTQKIVVDYSSPNIAKQMHVGHIRSTIIGHAIVHTLRFLGHEVIGDNHLGDWGTQFGLLIAGLARFRPGVDVDTLDIAALEDVYKKASALSKEDSEFADLARAELAKLQQGDADNLAAWERFVAITRKEVEAVYARLGVEFEWWKGESFYQSMVPAVVDAVKTKGLARVDQGALCIFFNELEDAPPSLQSHKAPFIVLKKDGASNYVSTDIATVMHRAELGIDKAIYVTDKRQGTHFEPLFEVVKRLGYTLDLQHVSFGAILGDDGKPMKTRGGDNVSLMSLLDEAEQRALKVMVEELSQPEELARELAPAVGVGAVKYADLHQNLNSDYVFDIEKMVAFKGNAGPYIQYAAARVGSILRKGEIDEASIREVSLVLEHPAEKVLARKLMRFADVVHSSADACLPHFITDHLYEVASGFSSFFEACPVLASEGATRETRVALTVLTGRQLRRGLHLLGIESPERM